MMNSMANSILKHLLNSGIYLNEISDYFGIEKNSTLKYIKIINLFLKSLNISLIEKNGEYISLNLSKEELQKILSYKETMSNEEKKDYLYLTVVGNGFINLESEREKLDISRSTVLRLFEVIKENFIKNETKIIYEHRKGLKVLNLSQEDKLLFCRKVMKLIVYEETLPTLLQKLLKSFKHFDTNEELDKISPIFDNISLPFVDLYLMSYILSLKIYSENFNNVLYYNKKLQKNDEFENIKNIVENKIGATVTETFKENLVYFLSSLDFDYLITNQETKEKAQKIYEVIKKEFELYEIEENLEKEIMYMVYLSLFKFENKIIKHNFKYLGLNERIVLNKLNSLLKNISVHLFEGDKILITLFLKKIIIQKNLLTIKNVLIYLENKDSAEYKNIDKELKDIHPHIDFELDTYFLHTYGKNISNFTNYDLVISDSKVDNTAFVIDQYANHKIKTILEEKAFEMGVNNIEK